MANIKHKKSELDVDVSLKGIKQFIDFAQECNVHSISVDSNGKKIKITKNPRVTTVTNNQPESLAEESIETDTNFEEIKSLFIGSFHPVDKVVCGTQVKKGEIVANIYSMKIEHPIKAERDCVIKEILAEENDVIEYGQPLFYIE